MFAFRTLREIFQSLDVNDTGTVSLGEVSMIITCCKSSVFKYRRLSGLGDVAV